MMCCCGGRLVSMGTDEWWETKTKKHVTVDNKLKVHESKWVNPDKSDSSRAE